MARTATAPLRKLSAHDTERLMAFLDNATDELITHEDAADTVGDDENTLSPEDEQWASGWTDDDTGNDSSEPFYSLPDDIGE